ncbi:nickel pincer cofactor biosynthesis protein LarC [Pseudalkalibacillus salsuginis]|uniref:nickel pincer cofactor biosynthesis protein LarC n=1 Tax=Pseudalkalibacillus salsuginis TaxID=2910972 RepID=UPI001F1C4419|nr:nickel pincer cofactor biosynthesis protein LarC [Pseudalkalibacillus salsuginis]MCF6411341.1 nickel pincer cofactor biosynthesis protein LarC [Pseudalkalibacillus salsuginis]
MKCLYLDCQSGISGDMTLTALIDLGADIQYITEELEKLPIDPFKLGVKQVDKKGIASKELVLELFNSIGSHHHHEHDEHHHRDDSHHHEHRKAATILEMIEHSDLPVRVKERSKAVFEVIALAEGKIHGMDPADVHFHEVGSMDSIIDVIGVCLGLENLNVERIIASPVPTGYGKVQMAHGLYPIPAPATAEILKGIPLADFHVEAELTTPTGAGFLKALASEFGQIPAITMERIGYGAGKKNFDHPNVLRAILFEERLVEQDREPIEVLECQIDDMTGETFGYVMEKLFESGALDAYYTPVQMKKNRPGTLVTVLASPSHSDSLEEILLHETSTFGIRKTLWNRIALERRIEVVETSFGNISVKVGYKNHKIYQVSPEYEDIRKAAMQYGIPFEEVYFTVKEKAQSLLKTAYHYQ